MYTDDLHCRRHSDGERLNARQDIHCKSWTTCLTLRCQDCSAYKLSSQVSWLLLLPVLQNVSSSSSQVCQRHNTDTIASLARPALEFTLVSHPVTHKVTDFFSSVNSNSNRILSLGKAPRECKPPLGRHRGFFLNQFSWNAKFSEDILKHRRAITSGRFWDFHHGGFDLELWPRPLNSYGEI